MILRLSDISTPRCSDQSGVILVMMALVIVGLLSFAGLAVDVGNLYRAQHNLQKAADAGALAAIGYSIQVGRTQFDNEVVASYGVGGEEQFLEEKAREVILANLANAGFPDDSRHPVTITPRYRVSPSANVAWDFQVSVSRDIDYLLMDLVPLSLFGVSNTATSKVLDAQATSARRVANIVLMLDFSDSMACPATGSCICQTPSRTGPCASPTKLDGLLDGVKQFLQNFDIVNDRIVIVPFNITSQAYTLPGLASNLGMSGSNIDQVIDGLKTNPGVSSNTNICDAMMRAHQAIDTLAPNQETAYVLFSDGAPTAGRFLFANPTALLPVWNPDNFGDYDYTHYSIEWTDASGHRPGPSVLTQTNLLQMGHVGNIIPASATGAVVPGCGAPTAPPVYQPSDLPIVADQVFDGCLNDLAFHLPQSPTPSYGAGGQSDDPNFVDWRKQYYNCAVQMSDYLRSERGTIHVIGLGDPTAFGSDPYQDIDDISSRKDVFLARIANDYLNAVIRPQNAAPPWRHPEFNYTNYIDYDNWNGKASPRQGTYLATPNPSEVKRLFQKIAKKIQLSLVQ